MIKTDATELGDLGKKLQRDLKKIVREESAKVKRAVNKATSAKVKRATTTDSVEKTPGD